MPDFNTSDFSEYDFDFARAAAKDYIHKKPMGDSVIIANTVDVYIRSLFNAKQREYNDEIDILNEELDFIRNE